MPRCLSKTPKSMRCAILLSFPIRTRSFCGWKWPLSRRFRLSKPVVSCTTNRRVRNGKNRVRNLLNEISILLEGSCHCGAVRFSLQSVPPYPFNIFYCSITINWVLLLCSCLLYLCCTYLKYEFKNPLFIVLVSVT